MTPPRGRSIVLTAVLCGATLLAEGAGAGDAEPRKVSTFAPAADLTAEAKQLVEAIQASLANQQVFAAKDSRKRLAQQAASLRVVALGLALHDSDHALKASAADLYRAAGALLEAKNLAAAQRAAQPLAAAVNGQGKGKAELRWGKAAPLDPLMEQVGIVETALRRGVRRLERRPEPVQQQAAFLAVVAQSVAFDPPDGTDGDALADWRRYCHEMRDASAALNHAAHAKDAPAGAAAVKRLMKSCEACHADFR